MHYNPLLFRIGRAEGGGITMETLAKMDDYGHRIETYQVSPELVKKLIDKRADIFGKLRKYAELCVNGIYEEVEEDPVFLSSYLYIWGSGMKVLHCKKRKEKSGEASEYAWFLEFIQDDLWVDTEPEAVCGELTNLLLDFCKACRRFEQGKNISRHDYCVLPCGENAIAFTDDCECVEQRKDEVAMPRD